MVDVVKTPYSSAVELMETDSIPRWLDVYNGHRLASYDVYDDLYDNSADQAAALLRGSDDKPIYVPTAKRLINTLARYIGRGWGFKIDPTVGSAEEQKAAEDAFIVLFKRERIPSKFSNGKRKFLRRGDWVWYIKADPSRPAGRRISVMTVDPRTYFVHQEDPTDLSRVTGASLIEEYLLSDGKTIALKEQRWTKPIYAQYDEDDNEITSEEIEYELIVWELKNFEDPDKRKAMFIPGVTVEAAPLPGITSLPLYHIKNNSDDDEPYGSSELAGIESLIAGVNQAISDEDLALAMTGLGTYVTDSGAPLDANGNETNWQMGPQVVVEVGVGRKFERLTGVTSITPVQDHVDYLEEQAYGVSGVNDIALGTRGVVSESGIALSIRMQPLFDASDDRDMEINDIFTQMFYDLQNQWFPVYEPETPDFRNALITSETDTGDRLPFDRAGRWAELTDGYAAGIFSLEYVHKELVDKFGYKMDKDDLAAAIADAEKKAISADPYAARLNEEVVEATIVDEDGDA